MRLDREAKCCIEHPSANKAAPPVRAKMKRKKTLKFDDLMEAKSLSHLKEGCRAMSKIPERSKNEQYPLNRLRIRLATKAVELGRFEIESMFSRGVRVH